MYRLVRNTHTLHEDTGHLRHVRGPLPELGQEVQAVEVFDLVDVAEDGVLPALQRAGQHRDKPWPTFLQASCMSKNQKHSDMNCVQYTYTCISGCVCSLAVHAFIYIPQPASSLPHTLLQSSGTHPVHAYKQVCVIKI